MNVDFSFYIIFNLGTLIFSITEQFFPGTQAFTSPSDMASSGVWENIILCKTPTFDGVCGKCFYIILIWYLPKDYFSPIMLMIELTICQHNWKKNNLLTIIKLKLYRKIFHIHHQKWVSYKE